MKIKIVLFLVLASNCYGTFGDQELLQDGAKVIWNNNSQTFSIAASGLMSESVDYIWPIADGSSGQTLITDGAGGLSFVDVNAVAGTHDILSVTHDDSTTSAITIGDVIFANATPKWDDLAIGDTNDVFRVFGGLPDWQATTFITELGTIVTGVWQATDVGVPYGGTGVSTLTDGGILLGSGATAITALGVAANGQIPIGDGATDPVLATLSEGLAIDVANGAGSITLSFDPTELIGNRTWGDASTDTIVWTWDRATGTDPTMTFGNGFISHNGDLKILGDDLFFTTNTDKFILVADGTNFNPVESTGDIIIDNTGVAALQNDTVAVAEFLGSQDWGDMSTDANGTVSLDTNSVSDNEIDYTEVTFADFTDDVGYLLADGTVALAGAWDMGSQNLTNVNIDSGTVDGITTLGLANSVDVGNVTITANGLTIDGTFTDGILSIASGSITSGVNGTFTSTVQAEQITSTDDMDMYGHLLRIGLDQTANDSAIHFFGDENIGRMIYDESEQEFLFYKGLTAVGAGVTVGNLIAISTTAPQLSVRYAAADKFDISVANTGFVTLNSSGGVVTITDQVIVDSLSVVTDIDANSLTLATDLDVDGVANLDVTDIDGAVDMASTLTVAGLVTINNNAIVTGDIDMPDATPVFLYGDGAVTNKLELKSRGSVLGGFQMSSTEHANIFDMALLSTASSFASGMPLQFTCSTAASANALFFTASAGGMVFAAETAGKQITFTTPLVAVDGATNLGDGTNQLVVSDAGVVTLEGSAKREITIRPALDYTTVTAQGKPTRVVRGAYQGYSLPTYAADEELFFNANVPGRWEGTSDITLDILVALSGVEDVNDDFKLQCSWANSELGEPLLDTTTDVVVETNLLAGRVAAYDAYEVEFTIDYDVDVGNHIESHDDLALRLRRLAADGTEIAGEVIVFDYHLHFTVDKMFKAPE